MKRTSGLQKQVLKQYRQFLKIIRQKPLQVRPAFHSYIRQEYRKNQEIPKKDVTAIEFLLRRGQRTLEMMQDVNVVSINASGYSPIWTPRLK
jgi:succinate dehydrogenase assembly factor 1